MRENTAIGLVHPETIGGHMVWSDLGTSPGQLADKLRFGDPSRGWEGDDRLSLVLNEHTSEWEVWRDDERGGHHLVCRRPTADPLDERVIDMLMARDTRRTDPLGNLYRHNEAIEQAKMDRAVETMMEHTERFQFEVRKAGLA